MDIFVCYINSRSCFGFCVLLALGGFNKGQKDGRRLSKILPARQTHFWEFLGAPFGEMHLRTKQQNESVIFVKQNIYVCNLLSLKCVC